MPFYLGVDPFADPVGHVGDPGGHFGFGSWCAVKGDERVPHMCIKFTGPLFSSPPPKFGPEPFPPFENLIWKGKTYAFLMHLLAY